MYEKSFKCTKKAQKAQIFLKKGVFLPLIPQEGVSHPEIPQEGVFPPEIPQEGVSLPLPLRDQIFLFIYLRFSRISV